MKSCLWVFSLRSAVSVSYKSLEQIYREKELIFAKEFLYVCSGGFSTGAGFGVGVCIGAAITAIVFVFKGQCLNHLNSCLLLTYWPC